MVCCAGILQNLDRVTVKMAKEQSMSLNPEKISGLCGRLMCCLSFEHEGYAGSKKCPKAAKVVHDTEAFNAIAPKDNKTKKIETKENETNLIISKR